MRVDEWKYNRALLLWNSMKYSTLEIAVMLDLKEHEVYNHIYAMKKKRGVAVATLQQSK